MQRRKFSREFKLEAVKLIKERGVAVVQTARRAGRAPSTRVLSRLMTTRRDDLSKADAVTVAAIVMGVPTLAIARDLAERFHRMFQGP